MFVQRKLIASIPGLGIVFSVANQMTGVTRYAIIPHTLITVEQVNAYLAGTLVQDAFPKLNCSEREFITNGMILTEQVSYFDPDDCNGPSPAIRFQIQDR